MKETDGRRKGSAGFTLVEIIIVLALMGLVMAAAGGFINFSFSAEKKVEAEYDLQSEVRLATEILNNSLRNSSITFLMPGSVSDQEEDLVNEWDYIGVTEDGSRIVQYAWDETSGKHKEKVLVEQRDGSRYSLKFSYKEQTKLVGYDIGIEKTDGRALAVSSTVSAINSVAVDYNGSERNPAAVVAFRTDERPKAEKGKKGRIAISMVLDDSGSMDWKMDGNTTSNNSLKRKTIMKTKAVSLINSFPDNVTLGIVPFANNGNRASDMFDLSKPSERNAAIGIIPSKADGGTNTGDGLRRAYYQLKNGVTKAPDEEVLYYIILLTDGNPTYFSGTEGYWERYWTGWQWRDRWIDNLTYITNSGDVTDSNINGGGSHDDSGVSMGYTKKIGDDLLKNDTSLNIKTFVIGFTAKTAEVSKGIQIARNCNTDAAGKTDAQMKNFLYFEATSEESLGIAFDTIKESILSEYWHIYGPYGKPD